MSKSKYTIEILQNEANKYDTRYQFKQQNGNYYEAARRLGYLDQICEHMLPIRISFGQKICEQLFDQIFNIKGIYNDRSIIKPLELDIFYPSYKVAIEFNGRNWHQMQQVQTNDMIKKNKCESLGIKLFTIHESSKTHNNQIQTIKEQIINLLPEINPFLPYTLNMKDIINLPTDVTAIYGQASIKHFQKVISKYNSLKDFSQLEPGVYDTIRKINRMDLLEHFRQRTYPQKWRNMTDEEIINMAKNEILKYKDVHKNNKFRTILRRRNLIEKFKALY